MLRLAVGGSALWLTAAIAGAASGGKLSGAAAYTREDSVFLRQADSARRQPLLDRAAYVAGLRLEEDEEACVAYDPGRGECLLTVAGFNRAVEEWPSPPSAGPAGSGLPVAVLRRGLLQALLDEPFLRYRLARDSAADSLDREWRRQRDRKEAEARRDAGDSALKARYRARFAKDFQAREEKIVQVMATSDSAQADSLWRVLAASPGARPRSAWRWRTPDPADLPQDLKARVDTLAKGQVSLPYRAPYGFLLARWQSIRRRPSLSFEEAIPLLLALPDAPDPDSSRNARRVETQVAEYYRMHRRQLVSPDTARFRIRLGSDLPFPSGARLAGFFDLPPSVQDRLGRYLPARDGERLGPFLSPFGTWEFEVLGTSQGGGALSLAQARPLILAALGRGEEDGMERAIRETQTRDRQLWNQLATTYLESRLADDSARAAPDPRKAATPPATIAAGKLEWMRAYLHVRFVELREES